MFLHQFLVSILPFVLEHRLGLDPELIQRVSEILLAETALVSFIVTPVIGRYTDHLGARTWLLLGLFGELGGSMIIASAHSCNVSLASAMTYRVRSRTGSSFLLTLIVSVYALRRTLHSGSG